MRLRLALLLAATLVFPSLASAAPIGTFEWVYESWTLDTGEAGQTSAFKLTNESSYVFDSILVGLYDTPDATASFASFTINQILPFNVDDPFGDCCSGQTLDEVLFPVQSSLLLPDQIYRAHLSFLFNNTVVGADLFARDLTGDSSFLATAVDVVAPDAPPPAPVPEPGTLLLLVSGVAAVGCRRLSVRRSADRVTHQQGRA